MKINYRPEIDGLRAIAVVSVIFYHAQITFKNYQFFKGGYIGVDIFFVISGYLITTIILKELFFTNKFSFRLFYEKRIRRILPVLLLILLISIPFAFIYLIPSRLIDYSKSTLSTLGFASNIYFYFTGQEYGAESSLLKPLLHTWSLAVEEQFYILFPIFLLIIFKFFKEYLIHILIIMFVISLILADWASKNYPSLSFYFLPTRAWELLAGSILAYFEIKSGQRGQDYKFGSMLTYFGTIIIFFCIIYFDHNTLHPSYVTLLPVSSVCLIIWFSKSNQIITRVLSSKIFVGIGLISYSLYLWHYPIFSFMRIEYNYLSLNHQFIALIMTFFLSIGTFLIIEKPARNKKYNLKLIFFPIFISIIFIGLFNNISINKNGFKNRLPVVFENLNVNKECQIESECKLSYLKNKNIFLIGDSYAEQIHKSLKKYAKISNASYNFFGSVCNLYPGFVLYSKIEKRNLCNNSEKDVKKLLTGKIKDSIIIVSGRHNLYFNNTFFNSKKVNGNGSGWTADIKPMDSRYNNIQMVFRDTIENYAINNKVILIYPSPEFDLNVPSNLTQKLRPMHNASNILKKMEKTKFINIDYSIFKSRSDLSFKILDSIKGENIYRVYPHKLMCNTVVEKKCIAHDNLNIYFYDDHHLSQFIVKQVNLNILNIIQNIKSK